MEMKQHFKMRYFYLLFLLLLIAFCSFIPGIIRPSQVEIFTEIMSARTLTGKVYAVNDSVRIYSSSIAPIHYDSSGVMNELNFNPGRVNNTQLDGWLITQAGWHFALGQPSGKSDGWVGFGGQRGRDRFVSE